MTEQTGITREDILALDAVKQARFQACGAIRAMPEYQAGIAMTACAWALIAIAEQRDGPGQKVVYRCKGGKMLPIPDAVLRARRRLKPLPFRERLRAAWRILREGR